MSNRRPLPFSRSIVDPQLVCAGLLSWCGVFSLCSRDGLDNTADNCPAVANVDQVRVARSLLAPERTSRTMCTPRRTTSLGILIPVIQSTAPLASLFIDQVDSDGDTWGDACDLCPDVASTNADQVSARQLLQFAWLSSQVQSSPVFSLPFLIIILTSIRHLYCLPGSGHLR